MSKDAKEESDFENKVETMSDMALDKRINYADREVIDTIKQTVAKGATDAQLAQFLQVCKATGLNPFLREVWCIAATNTIMASRDGYLRVANENQNFDGMTTTVERDDKQIPIKAICTVYRKDRSHPIVCEAYYNEYKKDSQVWRQYPSAMISKVAEVLALKRSFAINGVVTEEEIGPNPEPLRTVKPIKASSSAAFVPDSIDDPTDDIPDFASTDYSPVKSLLRVALKSLAAENRDHDEEGHFKILMDNKKAKLEHIDRAGTPEQIKKLEECLKRADELLGEKE